MHVKTLSLLLKQDSYCRFDFAYPFVYLFFLMPLYVSVPM